MKISKYELQQMIVEEVSQLSEEELERLEEIAPALAAMGRGAAAAGRGIAKGAAAGGRAIAKGAKKAAPVLKKGAQAAGQAIAKGAKAVGQGIKKGAEAAGTAAVAGIEKGAAAGAEKAAGRMLDPGAEEEGDLRQQTKQQAKAGGAKSQVQRAVDLMMRAKQLGPLMNRLKTNPRLAAEFISLMSQQMGIDPGELQSGQMAAKVKSTQKRMSQAQQKAGLAEAAGPGPWDTGYSEWADKADQAMQTYKEGSAQEFIEFFEHMSPEDHAGIYHNLHKTGGMDPMKGVDKDDPNYVSWRDRPNRDPDKITLATIIRRMMDTETHAKRREMTEPPSPSHGEPLSQRYPEEHGEESLLMQKYFGPSEVDEAISIKSDIENMIREEISSIFE